MPSRAAGGGASPLTRRLVASRATAPPAGSRAGQHRTLRRERPTRARPYDPESSPTSDNELGIQVAFGQRPRTIPCFARERSAFPGPGPPRPFESIKPSPCRTTQARSSDDAHLFSSCGPDALDGATLATIRRELIDTAERKLSRRCRSRSKPTIDYEMSIRR